MIRVVKATCATMFDPLEAHAETLGHLTNELSFLFESVKYICTPPL
jgi:hypothetical protein